MDTVNILICGVGGQGVLLAGDIIAETAIAGGFDAKKSEVHGMAQRGGSVVSHVRARPTSSCRSRRWRPPGTWIS
jgi:indolepyruvate ferredoxin oxidoreductase beta subunit